jgi:RNA polymerase sigma-70 factor (ECF subfamily)
MQAVYRVLGGLDTDPRIAFALRFVAGMEPTEVAASCGVSLATIKRRLSRAQSNFASAARREPALAEWLEAGITEGGAR